MSTVLAVGVAVLDVQQTVARLPLPDEKLVAEDLLVAAGGPAANAAVTAAALGARALLLTRVGASPLGALIHADLAGHGVEVLDRAGPGDSPAVSTVLVTRGTGQRAVVCVGAVQPGATAGSQQQTMLQTADILRGAAAVVVDGHHLDLALPVARAARASGVPVLLDGGSWKQGLQRLLPLVDVALVSADFRVPREVADRSRLPAQDVLGALLAMGPAVAACSRGGQPIELRTSRGAARIPVPAVDVVDTLGAGDVLHGAMATWLAVRGSGDVERGLAWAAAVAADSCSAAGARGWLADVQRLTRHRDALAG